MKDIRNIQARELSRTMSLVNGDHIDNVSRNSVNTHITLRSGVKIRYRNTEYVWVWVHRR